MSGPRVAVTGATGLVGHHLIAELIQRNYRPIAVARTTSNVTLLPVDIELRRADLNQRDELTRAFAGCSAVIHLAGAVDFGSDWPRFKTTNVEGTANVL